MSNLWSGRFSKELDSAVNDFNSSLHFDQRMYAQDIQGSVAHAKMLAATGIIPAEDGEKIVVEDISVNRKLVEELRDRILKYGLSLCHLKEYIYDWLCEVTDVLRSA